jgi:hypothetical protein
MLQSLSHIVHLPPRPQNNWYNSFILIVFPPQSLAFRPLCSSFKPYSILFTGPWCISDSPRFVVWCFVCSDTSRLKHYCTYSQSNHAPCGFINCSGNVQCWRARIAVNVKIKDEIIGVCSNAFRLTASLRICIRLAYKSIHAEAHFLSAIRCRMKRNSAQQRNVRNVWVTGSTR